MFISNLTGGQSKINFANDFDADLQEDNKKQTRNLSNDFEITKIITSEEDQLLTFQKDLKRLRKRLVKNIMEFLNEGN